MACYNKLKKKKMHKTNRYNLKGFKDILKQTIVKYKFITPHYLMIIFYNIILGRD